MTFNLLRQIVLLGMSLAIIFLFIQPKLVDLRVIQAEVEQFETAIDNATQFTRLLQSQLNSVNSISNADQQAMNTFLPNTLDPVVVSRDLQSIAERNSMRTTAISYTEPVIQGDVRAIQNIDLEGEGELSSTVEPVLSRTPFTMTVQGSYESFITFLQSLEANVYPLRVVGVTVDFTPPSDELASFFSDPLGTYTVVVEATSMEVPL